MFHARMRGSSRALASRDGVAFAVTAERARPPLWNAHDTRTLLRLPVALAMAVLLSDVRRQRLLRRAVAVKIRARSLSVRRAEELLVPLFLPVGVIEAVSPFLERLLLENELAMLQVLHHYRRRPTEPDIRIEGAHRVPEALAAGRGVILWVAPMAHAALVTKMAWHRAGWPVAHLSRYSHGVSATRLGARLLNPVVRRVEDRYLAERIVIGLDRSPATALQVLRRRLAQKRPVSITALAGTGSALAVPFLGRRLRLSLGPPRLARATGAPLLPVFCWRETEVRFVVSIGSPLPIADGPEAAVAGFARSFEPVLRRFPDQLRWPNSGELFETADASR